MKTTLWLLTLLLVGAPQLAAARTSACAGDCNGDDAVGIAELLRSVVASASTNPDGECPRADMNGDGAVSSGEIRVAVDHLFDRCGHGPIWVDRPDLCLPLVEGTPPANEAVALHATSAWQAETTAPWLHVTPSSGTGDAPLTFSVDADEVANGLIGEMRIRDASGVVAKIDVGLSVYTKGLAKDWVLQNVVRVDAGPEITSLGIDPSGRPAITFTRFDRDRNQDLWYGRLEACQWELEKVERQSQASSLVFDAAGRPHVAFTSSPLLALRYGIKNGGTWNIETVEQAFDGITGFRPTLALDSAELPHVAYQIKAHLFDLKYATFDGTTWNIETVDDVDLTGWDCSLALDSADTPYISYHTDPSALRFAMRTPAGWVTERVGPGGKPSSLQLDADDRPMIAHHAGGPDGALQFVVLDDEGEWQAETVDHQGNQLRAQVSMALDAAQVPHVAYVDVANHALKYATRRSDGTWQTQTIDQHLPDNIGDYCALQIDGQGVAHISYADLTNRSLKYARGPAQPSE